MLKQMTRLTRLPLALHGVLAVASVVWFGWSKGLLDASYAASGHPVDYATGQTSFSGAQIKDYYAVMSEAGTLDVYLATQGIDFLFIMGFLAIGAIVCILIARLSRSGSFGRRVGVLAGLSLVIGGISDMAENAVSFIMLADPQGFADWLALPYSGFAVLKFALITLAMGLVLVSLFAALVGRLSAKPKIG